MSLTRRLKDAFDNFFYEVEDIIDGISDVFRRATGAKRELTELDVAGELAAYLKDATAWSSQPFPGYEVQGQRAAQRHNVAHLVTNMAEKNSDGFFHLMTRLLDDAYADAPGVAVGFTEVLLNSAIIFRAVWLARQDEALYQQEPHASALKQKLDGLSALCTICEHRQHDYIAGTARKSPELILDWAVGRFGLDLANGNKTESHRTIDKAVIYNTVMRSYGCAPLAQALDMLDLQSFFAARPADVLVAGYVLAELNKDKGPLSTKKYDHFKGLAQNHPERGRLTYFTGVIDEIMTVRRRPDVPGPANPQP